MAMKWLKGVAGILLCLMVFTGCLASALIGVGATGAMAGYKWMEGTMTMDYPRSLPEMDQAVQQVCKEYRIKITERKISPTKGTMNGVDPNGDDVSITLEAKPNNITAVGVRVGGFMGNKEASEMFHKQLAKNLGL
jgi:hypothetical protein